uniref:EKC/KEOPS complex subunit GON7 n=1 Tax=Scophthalmus maximus TaxID=52904 RepID=A0A8D3DZ36_SCOMX
MSGMALSAELQFRDGQRRKICVQVENKLSSLITGINDLIVNVSQLLSELVEQEKSHGDYEVSDEEDEEREDPPDYELQPSTKRFKL